MNVKVVVMFVLGMLLGLSVHSAEPVVKFDTEAQAALYLQLTKDHRCLKCQNQNLDGSSAGIAQDLKREIRQRVIRGESGEEISAYLVTRYGDFVLYKPPFKASTYVLWIGPFLLLFVAIWYAIRISRKPVEPSSEPDPEALTRARALLDD